jgi:hypothetical protein
LPWPILVNVWYPASKAGDAKRMPHRGYLEIGSADPLLARFATKLAQYDRGVIAKEVMAKPAKELTDREKRLLDQFLDTPTACVRNAPPADGKFPLVIYHSGYGSSFEDIKDMDHDDYVSQGGIRRERLYQFHRGDPKQTAEARDKEQTALERARVGYQTLCRYILRFFQAELKADAAGKEFLAKRSACLSGGCRHPSNKIGEHFCFQVLTCFVFCIQYSVCKIHSLPSPGGRCAKTSMPRSAPASSRDSFPPGIGFRMSSWRANSASVERRSARRCSALPPRGLSKAIPTGAFSWHRCGAKRFSRPIPLCGPWNAWRSIRPRR